ncbi:hypothetical protein XELAEV_18004930mg [Xenopus laevis]|nr:hypothetical protein XELAEV_18004930mg [Xenopus laevis]
MVPGPFDGMVDWYFNGQWQDADNRTAVLSSNGGDLLDRVHDGYSDRVQPSYNGSLTIPNLRREDNGWYKSETGTNKTFKNILFYLNVYDKVEENVNKEAKGMVSFSMPCIVSGRLLYHGADMHNNNPKEVLHCDNKSSPGHVTDMYQTRLVPSCNGSSDLTDLREEDGGLYTWECEGTNVYDIHLTVRGAAKKQRTRTWLIVSPLAMLFIGGFLWCWKRKSKGSVCRRKQGRSLETYVEVRQNEDNQTLEASGKHSHPNGNTKKNLNEELIVDDTKRMEEAPEPPVNNKNPEAGTNGAGGNNTEENCSPSDTKISGIGEEAAMTPRNVVEFGKTNKNVMDCETMEPDIITEHPKKKTWKPISTSTSDIIRNNTINKDKREMDPGGKHIEPINGIINGHLSKRELPSINDSGIEVDYNETDISEVEGKYRNKLSHLDKSKLEKQPVITCSTEQTDKRDIITESGTFTDIDSDPVIYKGGEGQGHGDKATLDPDNHFNDCYNVYDSGKLPFPNSIIEGYNHDGDIGKTAIDPGLFTSDMGSQETAMGKYGPMNGWCKIDIDNNNED